MKTKNDELQEARKIIRRLVDRLDGGRYPENGDRPYVTEARAFLRKTTRHREYYWAILRRKGGALLSVCNDNKAADYRSDPRKPIVARISYQAFDQAFRIPEKDWKAKYLKSIHVTTP